MPFELFSRRTRSHEPAAPFIYDATPAALRVQVWFILDQAVGDEDFGSNFFKGLKDFLCDEFGRLQLSKKWQSTPRKECKEFLIQDASDSEVLDIIDAAFQFF